MQIDWKSIEKDWKSMRTWGKAIEIVAHLYVRERFEIGIMVCSREPCRSKCLKNDQGYNPSSQDNEHRLDIFENPYGAPRLTESQNPPSKKPKSKRYFPKSKRYLPKNKRYLPKSKR